MRYVFLSLCFCLLLSQQTIGQSKDKTVELKDSNLSLVWNLEKSGQWKLEIKNLKAGVSNARINSANAGVTIIYSAETPSDKAIPGYYKMMSQTFIEGIDKHAIKEFDKVLNPVAINTAGEALVSYPSDIQIINRTTARLIYDTPYGNLVSTWQIQAFDKGSDILINTTFKPQKDGYYSLASPELVKSESNDLRWGTIPGYFQGDRLQSNLSLGYAYGQGVPDRPYVFRERCATTLTSILERKDGISISATIEPGFSRDAWTGDKSTHQQWNIGLSIMNRQRELTPLIYFPVLGETKSKLSAGTTLSFDLRYSIANIDWYGMLSHAINDVYKFEKSLSLRQNKQSLSDRVFKLAEYVSDDVKSLWVKDVYQGKKIGAQAYLGPVVDSDKDAIKNSDYGAMWMLSNISSDSSLKVSRLPEARNFKLVQQQVDKGFFQGAVIGQYYLTKSKKFTEEWSGVAEPIGITYYTMLDIGNILLFSPEDKELKERLKYGAETLLKWQKEDGSWELAYDNATEAPAFTDIKDLRATFYGLLVAYKFLKDPKYLVAAKKGADWYVEEGINKGALIGVCGDIRYIADFATVQSAQCLLDLYDVTKEEKYKKAAIDVARIYVGSIYTHPISNNEQKTVKGKARAEWEISQIGLGFEHGGNFGSATTMGPILLASHAGLFVRLYELTGDKMFVNMARSAAVGRDAFVNPETNVASYYWYHMDAGAGPYPHHAWWQIGWIMDYLLAEAQLRSGGKISFPSGLITPKVGPHKSYGFESGKIYGNKVDLKLFAGLIHVNNPNIEHLTAVSKDGKKVYVVLMNDLGTVSSGKLKLDGKIVNSKKFKVLNAAGKAVTNKDGVSVTLNPYGLTVYTLEAE